MLGIVVVLWAWGVGGAHGAVEVTSVSGSAFGEQVAVTVLGIPVTSGPLPTVTLPSTGGGPFTNSALSASVPGLLSAGILQVSTQGATGLNGFARSSAEVATVSIPTVLSADVVRSRCRSDASGSTGSTSVVNLAVGNLPPITANPAPNTTIPLAGVGTVILNEQTISNTPGSTAITVNAVHVILDLGPLGQGDIILAQSHCDVTFATVTTTSTSTTSTSTTSTTIAPLVGHCDGEVVTIKGTKGDDVLIGTPGPDVIAGLAGDDIIDGLGGDDKLCGDAGNDTISGGDGDDILFGQADDDALDGGAHVRADGCHGGQGVDTATNTCERVTGVP